MAFTWPPTASKWLDSVSVGAQRTDFQNNRGIDRGHRLPASRRRRAHAPAVSRGVALRPSRYRKALRRRPRTRRTWRPATCCRRVDDLLSPTRGFMADVTHRRRHPGGVDRRVRTRGRADGGVVSDRSRHPARVSRGSGCRLVVFARGRTLGASVPHRRRYDGARLRVSEPRRPPRAKRSSADATTRSRAPRRSAGSTRRGALPRSSMPAMPWIRSTTSSSRSAMGWARDCERRSARSGSTSRTARRRASGGCTSPSG